jgi:hypothetical protein
MLVSGCRLASKLNPTKRTTILSGDIAGAVTLLINENAKTPMLILIMWKGRTGLAEG